MGFRRVPAKRVDKPRRLGRGKPPFPAPFRRTRHARCKGLGRCPVRIGGIGAGAGKALGQQQVGTGQDKADENRAKRAAIGHHAGQAGQPRRRHQNPRMVEQGPHHVARNGNRLSRCQVQVTKRMTRTKGAGPDRHRAQARGQPDRATAALPSHGADNMAQAPVAGQNPVARAQCLDRDKAAMRGNARPFGESAGQKGRRGQRHRTAGTPNPRQKQRPPGCRHLVQKHQPRAARVHPWQ